METSAQAPETLSLRGIEDHGACMHRLEHMSGRMISGIGTKCSPGALLTSSGTL